MREWICLLRAINLGARNKVSMPRLRDVLGSAGFSDVRTYLQSGNVVVGSRLSTADDVAAMVRSLVSDEFGVDTPVLIRTPEHIRGILAWSPFPETAAAAPTTVQVMHLDVAPERARVAAALAEDWSPDELAVQGREACVRYAKGMHGSRLQGTTLLNRLGVNGTARNWRTLTAIGDLLRDRSTC